jgi:hypothetical protein
LCSFFNELATEKSSKILFHFLTISTERKTMLMTSVSFFNEIATEKRNYARDSS